MQPELQAIQKKYNGKKDQASMMAMQEEMKTYPFGDVWDYFCEQNGAPVKEAWFEEVKRYEADVLAKRS